MYDWIQELDRMTFKELADFIYDYDQYFKSKGQPLRPSEFYYKIYILKN